MGHREINRFAGDHTAIKWKIQNLKPSCTVAESILLTTSHGSAMNIYADII